MFEGKKTYSGILIAFLPTLAGFVGFSVDPASIAEAGTIVGSLIENVEAICATVGAGIAWYGRSVTKK